MSFLLVGAATVVLEIYDCDAYTSQTCSTETALTWIHFTHAALSLPLIIIKTPCVVDNASLTYDDDGGPAYLFVLDVPPVNIYTHTRACKHITVLFASTVNDRNA